MAENRQLKRVPYVAGGTFQYRDTTFSCRLENISMAGALISIRNLTATDFRPGHICILNLFDEMEGQHISIEVLIAHHSFSYVGLEFIYLDVDAQVSLEIIIEREGKFDSGIGTNVPPIDDIDNESSIDN